MNILITLLIFCLIAGLIYWFITLIPLPAPFKNFALAILIIIFIIYLAGLLFGVAHWPVYR